ncbi:uncharacterized protein LOC127841681 isoform X3 [Dreissena polymorpha]|uniref:uncharacterized protein LOC127841681 isoform X3 n=1 Tax=Dreissena polymorpha TaxID=45954 RepID=UPI0022650510|nr:uncharacterized protein LOC127841681 isoform X3 [Dreissena polymorpha]XP_052226696.1 uncharacterized protein LOC127841681 isoform X3 [Dreissena polymorpha]XP_052226697.1 uncharacterized protein LOC127841681 isoform X3 [Dreissena polymorpha]
MPAIKEAHVRRALGSNNGNKSIVTSAAVAKALSDIGVNEETIQWRRTTQLYMEALQTINQQARGEDSDVYHLGSQSEGSTTVGMNSDYDCLECYREVPVIQNTADRQFEKEQLLVVTDMSPPPQCCCLQWLKPDYSITLTDRTFPHLHIDAHGRVFLRNIVMKMYITPFFKRWGRDYIQHGPSLTIDDTVDMVYAFHCAKLPEDCQYIFRRPKPGHWPSPALLNQLKDSGVFLVSTAHVENTAHWDPRQHIGILKVRTFDKSHELYWRLSTNSMERLLMFDLSMTQMKVYVLMKIINKEFCKPLVGDRLSTFHLKTTLMYSVEMSPQHIWKDENLIQCLKLCLTTLRRWLNVRYCPHYTTANGNLFEGKLRLNEFPVLIELFTDIIRDDLFCLYNVEMDDLGHRISSHSPDSTSGRHFKELDIVVANHMFNIRVAFSCTNFYLVFRLQLVEEDTSQLINDHARYIQKLETINKTSTGHIRLAVSTTLPFHYSIQAAMKASLCIVNNLTLPQEIFTLCDKSLMSDVTSSRLKLASIYFSVWRFEEAAAILKQADALISNKIIYFSPFFCYKNPKFGSEIMGGRKEFIDILQKKVAVCTIFSRHDMNCVPGQLVAEFYRTVTVEDASCRLLSDYWMDLAVVDSLPYLYYLQYLTFGTTGLISDKDSAFKNLHYHVISKESEIRPYHIETSLNLLGHCCELEGNLSEAWRAYKDSVKLRPQNNAAYWHMFRIIGGLIYGLRMLS